MAGQRPKNHGHGVTRGRQPAVRSTLSYWWQRLIPLLWLCGLGISLAAQAGEPVGLHQQAASEVPAPDSAAWQETLAQAKGQQVYFHTWGGSTQVNRYLRWAKAQVQERYNIDLRQVRVGDISESVSSMLREQGSREQRSAVDLIWLNGENFHALKNANLLLGKLSRRVPHADLLHPDLPHEYDFGVATDDYELPWGMAQFHLLMDRQRVPELAEWSADGYLTPADLLELAQTYPGELSYPRPPDFHGTTFLKQLLLALTAEHEALSQPANTQDTAAVLAPLFDYLDQLHPYLWRDGEAFMSSAAEQQRYLADERLRLAISFNPGELPAGQERGQFSDTTERVLLGEAAITNNHYLAVARHSQAPAAALVVLNFLLSEPAQERKADVRHWGDPQVIQTSAQPELDVPFPVWSEPHVSWQEVIQEAWRNHYE